MSQQMQAGLGSCLRRPMPEIRHLLHANRRFLQTIERRRNQRQTTRSLRNYLQQFRCRQLSSFKCLGRIDCRSRIIAAYHFGDFVYGLNYLLRQDTRDSYVQTLETSRAAYFDNMQRLFADQRAAANRQLPVTGYSPRELSACLKSKPCNLVMFADLPPGFGASTVIDCLGRQARFPRGIASLAVRNRVPVLPVICVSRQGQHDIVLGTQLEAGHITGSRSASINSLTQSLVDFFEVFLRRYPQQWRYLSVMPHYYLALQQQGSGQGPGEQVA